MNIPQSQYLHRKWVKWKTLIQLLSSWNRNEFVIVFSSETLGIYSVEWIRNFVNQFSECYQYIMIYFLQSIKTWHSNYGKQVELLFSREENSPCSWTRARSSQRHPDGGRLYKQPSTFPHPTVTLNTCFMLDLNLGAYPLKSRSSKTLPNRYHGANHHHPW